MALADRKIVKHEGGCISLTGNLDRYSHVTLDGHRYAAHRIVYMLTHPGVSIKGMYVHHMCRNRGCVLPQHLLLVTRRQHIAMHALDNVRPGSTMSR